MIAFDKLYCQLNEELSFDSQIQQIFGIGTNNNLYKKFGLHKTAHAGVLKIVSLNLEFDIEYYILKKKNVSFPLKQELKDNIRKKIIKKIYQGYRHQSGLPVHGQRTHSNSKTVKKTHNSNLTFSTGFKTENLLKKKKMKPTKVNKAKKVSKVKKKK
jgi:small subunit ribosomal protein S13